MKTAYLFLAVLVVLMYSITTWAAGREGFDNEKTVTPSNMYDDTYAGIYDTLWHSADETNQFTRVSIQEMTLADWPIASVKMLDMACGTSPHACWLTNLGIEVTGVDNSDAMLSKARMNCPSVTFENGDIMKASLFSPKSFSHTMLLGFSAYEFPNLKMVADNAYMWTQPGGQFVIHLVEPDKYDPLLNLASPFAAFSLQKYSLDRQIDSEIYFDKFKYRGTLNKKKGDEDASFVETFTYYDTSKSPSGEKYREQTHKWKMPSLEECIDTIRSAGFRHKESVHMVSCGKEYQYLVYFTK